MYLYTCFTHVKHMFNMCGFKNVFNTCGHFSCVECLINIVTGHRGFLTFTHVLMLMYVVSGAQALTSNMQGQRSTQSNRSGM